MKYTHLLEMSITEPRQYRITVIEDAIGTLMAYRMNNPVGDGHAFTVLGYFDTPEDLMKVLSSYLAMEQGR